MREHEIGPHLCPNCGRMNEAAAGKANPPRDGDWCICFGCAAICRFIGRNVLRLATDAEVEGLEDENRDYLMRAVSSIRAFRAEHPDNVGGRRGHAN